MSFLGGLFDRKPGGTFVGNLLRTAGNAVAPGVLGTGAGMISQQQYDSIHLSDADFYAKYGVSKTGNPSNPSVTSKVLTALNSAIHPVQQGISPTTGQPYQPSTALSTAKSFFSTYWWVLLIFPGGLIIYPIMKKFLKL